MACYLYFLKGTEVASLLTTLWMILLCDHVITSRVVIIPTSLDSSCPISYVIFDKYTFYVNFVFAPTKYARYKFSVLDPVCHIVYSQQVDWPTTPCYRVVIMTLLLLTCVSVDLCSSLFIMSCGQPLIITYAVVTTTIRFRFVCDSIAARLPFVCDRVTTILHYGQAVLGSCTSTHINK